MDLCHCPNPQPEPVPKSKLPVCRTCGLWHDPTEWSRDLRVRRPVVEDLAARLAREFETKGSK